MNPQAKSCRFGAADFFKSCTIYSGGEGKMFEFTVFVVQQLCMMCIQYMYR